jgi:hypothetical protein
MAYEEFKGPDGSTLFDFGNDVNDIMDFVLFINTNNFAVSDIETGVEFQVNHLGKTWFDSEAMVVSVHRSIQEGTPFCDGYFLSSDSSEQLEQMFAGISPMPMLDERAANLNDVGRTLCERLSGHFHNFVRSCSPKLYDGGNRILERLVPDFPRFNDKINCKDDLCMPIFKLAQLAVWQYGLCTSSCLPAAQGNVKTPTCSQHLPTTSCRLVYSRVSRSR